MKRPVIDVDELPHNADWTKQTVDFFLPDDQRPRVGRETRML